jgi:hypothetical protein
MECLLRVRSIGAHLKCSRSEEHEKLQENRVEQLFFPQTQGRLKELLIPSYNRGAIGESQ